MKAYCTTKLERAIASTVAAVNVARRAKATTTRWRFCMSLAAAATAAAATVAAKDCLKIWFSADLHG